MKTELAYRKYFGTFDLLLQGNLNKVVIEQEFVMYELVHQEEDRDEGIPAHILVTSSDGTLYESGFGPATIGDLFQVIFNADNPQRVVEEFRRFKMLN